MFCQALIHLNQGSQRLPQYSVLGGYWD